MKMGKYCVTFNNYAIVSNDEFFSFTLLAKIDKVSIYLTKITYSNFIVYVV